MRDGASRAVLFRRLADQVEFAAARVLLLQSVDVREGASEVDEVAAKRCAYRLAHTAEDGRPREPLAIVLADGHLEQFVEPLLFSVPQDSEEFYEAKRLLKFLDYFLGIDVQMVPANSLLREFIGGGCFKV